MSFKKPLVTLTSRIKGHHEHRYTYGGESFQCFREHDNIFSNNAIVVKSNKAKVIGHVPEGLDKILQALLENGEKEKNRWNNCRRCETFP